MRYFSIIFIFFLTLGMLGLHTTPTYDLTVMRSLAVQSSDGGFHIGNSKPQNIWYIGIDNPTKYNDNICIEWNFGIEKKQECIDHDGNEGEQIFTFPVLSEAVSVAGFRIIGSDQIDPSDITVYSMDTRPSTSRFTFSLPSIRAENGVVSRREWGADETMRYTDSIHWKTKWPAYLKYVHEPKTQNQLDAIRMEDERNNFLEKNFGANTIVMSLTRTEDGHPLLWPIQKVKQVSRIVLHHTAESMDNTKSDAEMIRGIYAYHTLTRQWGDIGYNYIVGQRGKIYEGRAGGDYVVASHAAYNNMGTVGISVLGDYEKNHLNGEQITGIESVITMMATKYGITLSDSKKGVKNCTTKSCYPFEVIITKSLLGHQDIGHTGCPGSSIYRYIPDFLNRLNRSYLPVYNPVQGVIEPVLVERIMNMTLKVDPVVSTKIAPPMLSLPLPIIRYIGPRFRVKLSYPDANNIVLATADGKIGKIILDKKKILMQSTEKLTIGTSGNTYITLSVGGISYTGSELRFSHTVVRIDSWNRVPEWDKSGKYNDNLFRDTIRILNNNGKLTVINDLPVEWYLKGLGEVSNTDLTEKIKVIIVAARSYARYYMDPKNRKFATRLYDGSDNPDEFQKYLGYSYEMRSPNVTKIVDNTRNQVITYSGSIIKAWYHSSSDGRTLSAFEYCIQNGSKTCSDIPYLQSVEDPGSLGRMRSGHGVGISGIGATYWANSGWDYKKIIQYYLKGVEIQRK